VGDSPICRHFSDGPDRDRTCDLGIKSPAYRRETEFEKTPFRASG
jgi:hypothetical protein